MRNQERRRAKKKGRDARNRVRPGAAQRHGSDGLGVDDPDLFGDQPGEVPPRQPTATEILNSMLIGVLQAHDGIARREIARSAARLVALASGPAGSPTMSRALLSVAECVVGTCWVNGWQPSDLTRVVGRELTALHLRIVVDVIAAQGRRYAAANLEPRWSAQLQELNATVWWGNDGLYLNAISNRSRVDPHVTAAAMFELLRLLSRLPEIARVGPPPGSYRAPTSPKGERWPEPDARILNRVRALLAKAESTEFPDEAEALSAKAQQLMAHHSISAALLDADAGRTDGPATRRISVDNPYDGPKTLLLNAVASANRCRSVWIRLLGCSTVVGYEADLEAVELLYTSLLVQATTAMTRAGSRTDPYGRSRTRAFRQSFLVAYASRIGERLQTATDAATSDAAAGIVPDDLIDVAGATRRTSGPSDPRLLPVLAARCDAVNDETERLFPKMSTHSVSSSDPEGWAHGTAAADRAILHGHAEVT